MRASACATFARMFLLERTTPSGVPSEPEVNSTTAGWSGLRATTLDGDETSYLEWLGAGVLEIREVAGAMHQSERRAAAVSLVHFGFDRTRLYVRVDVSGLVTGRVGLDGVAGAFTALGDPEAHVKILVEPAP